MTRHLTPGVTYTVEAWVKGENISGRAGLSILPASRSLDIADFDPDRIQLTADEGTYDWKRIKQKFVAPPKSDVLQLQTVLGGTGTLWIDDVRVSSEIDFDDIEITIQDPQRASVVEQGATDEWYDDDPDDGEDWSLRARINVPNFSASSLPAQSVYVDVEQLLNRLHADIDEYAALQLTDGGKAISFLRRGNTVLFNVDIPAFTVHTYYLYFKQPSTVGASRPSQAANESDLLRNLIQNPGFEVSGEAGWSRFGEGDQQEISTVAENGNASLRIEIFGEEARDETGEEIKQGCGLTQRFSVQPNQTYFFAASVKGSDTLKHSYAARAVFRNAAGKRLGGRKELSIHQDRYFTPAWRSLTMAVEAPEQAASVDIELAKTGSGTAWFDDVVFAEVALGTTGALALERKASADLTELALWQENPIEKVFPDDLPSEPLQEIRISAAGNETEPVQLVLRSPTKLSELKVHVVSPQDTDGNRLDQIEVGLVGYVPIDAPSTYYGDRTTPHWRMRIPQGRSGSDGWAGWWPDPILPTDVFDLPANETHAVWIEVTVPKAARAGEYQGSVEILQDGAVLKEIPLEVRVRSFELPETSSVQAIYDLRFRDLSRYGAELTKQEQNEAVLKFMKQHRISPETIRPQPKWSVQDGEVTADFTEFDAAAEYYFDELGFQITYTPWEFSLFGWAHPPREKFGEAPYPGKPPYAGADRSQLRPKFKKVFQSALRTYWEHMKEKGWADKVIMYISDEPEPSPEIEAQMKALCDMIHEVDPEIPIYVSVWWYRPEFDGYIDVWGVSHRGGAWGHHVPAAHLKQIEENGDAMVFTTDGMQCTDTPYLAFERLLPHFCFKYGASMYEFWGSNWQSIDPYNYGWHPFHRQSNAPGVYRWIRYPNGDGYCIYPGPPVGVKHLVASTRLKQAREGVEDYEYLLLLKQLIAKRKAAGQSAPEAEQALANALKLIDHPTADGRYSTGYLRNPDDVLTVRDNVASAIEGLTSQN